MRTDVRWHGADREAAKAFTAWLRGEAERDLHEPPCLRRTRTRADAAWRTGLTELHLVSRGYAAMDDSRMAASDTAGDVGNAGA